MATKLNHKLDYKATLSGQCSYKILNKQKLGAMQQFGVTSIINTRIDWSNVSKVFCLRKHQQHQSRHNQSIIINQNHLWA